LENQLDINLNKGSKLDIIIQTQIGPMTAQEALNILRYTNNKLLGFDESMLLTYLEIKGINYEK